MTQAPTSQQTTWWLRPALGIAIFLLTIQVCVAVPPQGAGEGYVGPSFLDVVSRGVLPLSLTIAWLTSALGLGLACTKLFGLKQDLLNTWGVFVPVGVALQLVLTNALFTFWLPASALAAWLLLAPGSAYTLWCAQKVQLDIVTLSKRVPWLGLVWAVPMGVLAVAALLPPGTIWQSEGNGYDTLSYHLMLPRQWLSQGNIMPVAHNVYSHLPSGMESAFTHLAQLRGAGDSLGLGDGSAVLAANVLHACMTLLCALAVSCATRQVLGRVGACVAGSVVLATPWAIVTGASAYNEMAVCLCAAGMVALVMKHASATDKPAQHWKLSVFIGLLGAGSAIAKPTALFMVCAPLGVMWLMLAPKRTRVRVIAGLGVAACVGLAAISAWLWRNWAHTGNPVFPNLAGVFGSGYWADEQAARWAGAHHEGGSVAHRAGLLFSLRGFLHAQWWLTPWLVVVAGVFAFVRTAGQARLFVVSILVVLGLQLLAWGAFTHVQSRFLLPLLPFGAVMCGLGAHAACGYKPFGFGLWQGAKGDLYRGDTGIRPSALPFNEEERMHPHQGPLPEGEGGSTGSGAILQKYEEEDGDDQSLRLRVGVLLVWVVCLVASFGPTFVFLKEPSRALGLVHGVERLNGSALKPMFAQAGAVRTLGPDVEQAIEAQGPVAGTNILLDLLGSRERRYMLGGATPMYLEGPVLYNTTWDSWPFGELLRAHGGELSRAADGLRTQHGIRYVLIDFAELRRLRASGDGPPGWADPDVSVDVVSEFVRTQAEVVFVWRDARGGVSSVLCDLGAGAAFEGQR